MRIAVVDIGTNSTRLLIAEVDSDGRVDEVERRSDVTRLGDGVDATGRLSDAAVARVTTVLARFREAIDAEGCERSVAVLTSAVRDASNGEEFVERVRSEFGLDAREIDGDEEARLTFLGATSERGAAPSGHPREPVLVIDIGGGSTEFVVGVPGGEVSFFVSTQAGVVRQSERHISTDPPEPDELGRLAAEVKDIITGAVPEAVRRQVGKAIAVAGTATSCAAMVQELEPYDPARVHGFLLAEGDLDLLLARLAQMTDAERRRMPGLHPDRAPTIVAGVTILSEILHAFGLEEVEVSEHDILRGVALATAGRA
jgi:exopolyphosphatase/guanosine-5'-triphosphate,3'-diphosphate pyrophosphatase